MRKTTKMTRFAIATILSLTLGFASTSCEDVIDVDLDEGTPQLVVDAFLTDISGPQLIRLVVTSPYFENAPSPAATGAVVTVTDDLGAVYNFTDNNNDGNYRWNAAGADTTMIQLGRFYSLSIDYDGQTFVSGASANPVPPIDSVPYEFREEEFGQDEGYYASFFAIDFGGREDWYWIRTTRNDTLISDPVYLNISKDAAFSGEGADGFTFILPIRSAVTPFDRPYNLGDTLTVELWSVSQETFSWLLEAQQQMTNAGLFATPPANVRTNIVNANSSSDVTAVGMFNVAMVSVGGARIQ